MWLIGSLFGGSFLVFLLHVIVEKFGGRGIRSLEPTQRATTTVGIAYLTASTTVAIVTMADGGGLYWQAFFYYLPGAFIVWFFVRRFLMRKWEEDGVSEADIFD